MCGKPQMELENPILPETQAAAEEGEIAVPLPIFEGEYVSVVKAGKICRFTYINYEQYYNILIS